MAVGVQAALCLGVEAGFHLAEVCPIEPVGCEAVVCCLKDVVGLVHFGEVGVVECDGDDGDGLVVVGDAGFFFKTLGEVVMHSEGDVGDVGEGTGEAVAGEGVEAAGVVAGCLGCDAVALDDGGADACLGEVVCGGCAHCAAADDCYLGCGGHGFLLGTNVC